MSAACSRPAFGAVQVNVEISATFHWPLWRDQAVAAARVIGFDSGK